MQESPNQKNIIHGSITAGGNVHIGDYLVTYVNNYFTAQEVKIPHRLTNNIPSNADHILGRDAELATTKTYLAQNQATVLFNGIGGIGKTSVASKYMALYGREYKHLAWITVQSTLAEAFTDNAPFLASLHITQQVQNYIEAKQLDKAFEYLFHQLNLLERTLVVIDNANDLDDLEQYKNWFDTANCHFIITSRSQPSEWATVEVDSLPEDEAVALFRKLHSAVSADDEAIKNLLSKLFYHTLLIELVAKAGASTGISFADLQTMIDTKFIHHQTLNETPIPTGKHGSLVPTNPKKKKIKDYIWLIFSKLKSLDKESRQLLKAMALLPVATPFDLDFLKEHFALFNIPNAVVHLDALIERGWIQKEQAEGQKPYFKIHPLIVDVVVVQLNLRSVFANNYIQYIYQIMDFQNLDPNISIFKIRECEILAERLVNLFFRENTEGVSQLLNTLNWYYYNFGLYQKALHYGQRALQIANSLPKFDENLISFYQNQLAIVYIALGQYQDAVFMLENSLENDIKNFGSDHERVATRYINLGGAYKHLERYDEAVDLLNKALIIDKNNFGDNNPRVANTQADLAMVYHDLKRYDEAANLAEQALKADIMNFGKDHQNVAARQVVLAHIYYSLQRYIDAKNLLEQALDCIRIKFGKDHPHCANILFWLALVYNALGRKEEAQIIWQETYQLCLKTYGETHPYTQNTLKMLVL